MEKQNLKKILFVGFGDLSKKCSALLGDQNVDVTGIARSENSGDMVRHYWRGDIADKEIQSRLGGSKFDIAVITLTPGERTEEAYRNTYIEKLKLLTEIWKNSKQSPGLVIFVSSSVVYGQEDGSWVDERSSTPASNFRGEIMLEAESIIQSLECETCLIRFSGIYGPQRDYLLRQVRKKKAGSTAYSNRIHVEDCVGVIVHLCQLHWSGERLAPIYLASDSSPETSHNVRLWLAQAMGVEGMPPAQFSSHSGKKCSNKLLLSSGYRFRYPNFHEGYRPLI